jgi:MFS family permease
MTSPSSRLVASSLIDWTGTGFYLAISAIFLTRSVGLTPGEVGLALAAAGAVAFAGGVHVSRLGDRFGQRPALIALHVLRAAAFAGLSASHSLPPTLAMLGVIALADQVSASVTQALASDLAGAGDRVALMARLRVVTNIGITLGTVPAGLMLAGGTDAFGVLLLANAVSYLAAAAIVASLPRPVVSRAAAARRRLLIPSLPTAALITVDGLLSMWNVVLNVGLPLWILQATAAPPALVAVLYGTNTVVAVVLQARISRSIRTYVGAASAQRLAGFLLAACCVCLAAAVLGGREFSTAVLSVAVLCLTLGELFKVSAAWQITFALAPAGRSAEFFATYGLGKVAFQVCGPVLITAVVLALGTTGWLLLALSFVIGSLATPAAARRARVRAVVTRPPADPPAFAPVVAQPA